jgi:hypothetical protein
MSARADFKDDIPIVLVHLGSKLPRHLQANLKYLKNFGKPIYLITDNKNIEKRFRNTSVHTYLYEHSLQEFAAIEVNTTHNLRFRDGFWAKAIIRLMALESFMKHSNSTSFIHLESDIWISPNFPFKLLQSQNEKISFPIESVGHGIPSVVYVPSVKSIENLVNFVRKSIAEDSSATDMSILYNYAVKYPQEVNILKTIPKLGNFSRGGHPNELASQVTCKLEDEGIFDALSIGMYFTGEDPRNNKGRRQLFIEKTDSFLNLKSSSLNFKGNRLLISKNGIETEVYNLHVHSKDIRVFKPSFFRLLLRLRYYQSKKGPRRQITYYLVTRISTSLKLSILRNLRKLFLVNHKT